LFQPKERIITMKKVESINKVINEKKATVNKFTYPKIPIERIEVAAELLQFHGKRMFVKSLVDYWKLKRKDRAGAPLIRNLDMMWCQTKYPPQPPPLRILGADGNQLVSQIIKIIIISH